MFGSLISATIRVATLPIDAANATVDVLSGGDGSKRSRTSDLTANPLSIAETVRDSVAETAKRIDD